MAAKSRRRSLSSDRRLKALFGEQPPSSLQKWEAAHMAYVEAHGAAHHHYHHGMKPLEGRRAAIEKACRENAGVLGVSERIVTGVLREAVPGFATAADAYSAAHAKWIHARKEFLLIEAPDQQALYFKLRAMGDGAGSGFGDESYSGEEDKRTLKKVLDILADDAARLLAAPPVAAKQPVPQ